MFDYRPFSYKYIKIHHFDLMYDISISIINFYMQMLIKNKEIFMDNIIEFVSSKAFQIGIKSVVVFAVAFVLVKLISQFFMKNKSNDSIHTKFIKNVVIAIIWICAFAVAASQFAGFSKLANTILAGSGILAAIIGLAAQESFANIFSGLFISIFKPFNIGDRIRIVGDETAGFVEDINLRHTVIRTYTNVRIIIPNSIIGSAKIENSTYTKGASYPIELDVAYECKDKRYRALEIMEEVVTSHEKFYDNRTQEQIKSGIKPTAALCTEFGESGIHLKILMWTEEFLDNAKACSECRMRILDRFEEEGIEIPYSKVQLVEP